MGEGTEVAVVKKKGYGTSPRGPKATHGTRKLAAIRRKKIALKYAAGQDIPKIAKDLGVCYQTVAQNLIREDVKEWIEKEHLRILENLPSSVDNISHLVNGMRTAEDKDDKRMGFEASKEVLKVAGIIPTATQSTFIQNIYSQNNLTLSPVIQQMLDSHVKSITSAYDVEAEEVASGAEEVREAQKS